MPDGKLRVENSRVILIPPDECGSFPQIVPVEGVSVRVNGVAIRETTTVMPTDAIELVPGKIETDGGCLELTISEDGLYACLRVRNRTYAQYAVLDTEEAGILQPKVTSTTVSETAYSPEQIHKLLNEAGIIYGVDQQAVTSALRKADGQETVVAAGLPPQPGKDAEITLFIAQAENEQPAADTSLSIDYRYKGEIPSVKKNALLAERIPAAAGKAGKTVTGKALPPPPGLDIVLREGKNTYLSDDGLRLYSSVLGRPVLEKKKQSYVIGVEPVYVALGDVDMQSGHIRFQGDVQINGRVNESMQVTSGGNVKILGSVTGALINAEGSVTVQNNVINSQICAGLRQSFAMLLYPKLVSFEAALVEILVCYQQIREKQESPNLRFGYVLELLVEKRFPDFTDKLEALADSLNIDARYDFSPEISEAVLALKLQLKDFSILPYQEISGAVKLLKAIEPLKNHFNFLAEKQSNIRVYYCLNSRLEACGNIVLAGQGCFHTDITAHGSVEITGVARGGVISARQTVKINKVGSEAAIRTEIIVPADQAIYLGKVHENTLVTVGAATYRFGGPASRVKVIYKKGEGMEFGTF